jgi:hypothetical protein
MGFTGIFPAQKFEGVIKMLASASMMEKSIRETIGALYVNGKFSSENSEFVSNCYREMVHVNRQLFDRIPFPVIFTPDDVYASAKEMRERVAKERVIYIYTGWSGHPFLSEEENNISRAVHDVWAHLVCGCPFTFMGEFNAYMTQRKHYPSWTWAVMFTETPVQTAAYYYCGGFPDMQQRAFIAPLEWLEICETELTHDYSANAIMTENGEMIGESVAV